jgi:hypothetical protein
VTDHIVNQEADRGTFEPNGHDLSEALAAALCYVGLGIPVLPLHGVTDGRCGCGEAGCTNQGKHPIGRLVPQAHLDATTDAKIIRRWFIEEPGANVGIALEAAGLVVIGPDSPEWDRIFQERGLPETTTVQTGGGEGHLHYYYRRPEGCPSRRICHSGKYDLMSDGYVVAAPSMHRSGQRYEALSSFDQEIPESPSWAVAMLSAEREERTDFEPVDPNEPPVRLVGEALERWRGERSVLKADGEIDRSQTLRAINDDLWKAGASRSTIYDAIRDRDLALWPEPKYAGRPDEAKRYAEIAGDPSQPEDLPDFATLGQLEGYELLDEVEAFLATFVVYPSTHALIAHTLWIAHTHMMDAWDSTPRIAFLSPEPASGKTRALEASELLVPRAVEAINVSAAYLFRKVDDPAGLPTILFDEIDTVFGDKARDHEDLRGLLNAGHRKGAVAGRCVIVGQSVQTVEYSAYCALGRIARWRWRGWGTFLTRSSRARSWCGCGVADTGRRSRPFDGGSKRSVGMLFAIGWRHGDT